MIKCSTKLLNRNRLRSESVVGSVVKVFNMHRLDDWFTGQI